MDITRYRKAGEEISFFFFFFLEIQERNGRETMIVGKNSCRRDFKQIEITGNRECGLRP